MVTLRSSTKKSKAAAAAIQAKTVESKKKSSEKRNSKKSSIKDKNEKSSISNTLLSKVSLRYRLFGLEQFTTTTYGQVPEWSQDNEYILTGYRTVLPKWMDVFRSLLYLHNQTFNIYSHYVGSLIICNICFVWFIYEYVSIHHLQHSADPKCDTKFADPSILMDGPEALWNGFVGQLETYWVYQHVLKFVLESQSNVYAYTDERHEFMEIFSWLVFFVCSHIMLLTSATFHLTICQSEKTLVFGSKCDYLGIVFMIYGSNFLSSFYALYHCKFAVYLIYLSVLTIIAIGCGIVSMGRTFYTPKLRPFRAAMFVIFGVCSGAPAFLLIYETSYQYTNLSIGLAYIILEGVIYISGAAIFALRFPEKQFPGKFDIWGNSHQIHHFCVVTAMVCHFYGNILATRYYHGVKAA